MTHRLLLTLLLSSTIGLALTCPATLKVGTTDYKYQRISVLNGKSGAQEYDLAPDDEKKAGTRVTQLWNLKDYRDMPLFLRCHYEGTEKVSEQPLPAPLKSCTQHFNIDAKGKISGPYDMVCY